MQVIHPQSKRIAKTYCQRLLEMYLMTSHEVYFKDGLQISVKKYIQSILKSTNRKANSLIFCRS